MEPKSNQTGCGIVYFRVAISIAPSQKTRNISIQFCPESERKVNKPRDHNKKYSLLSCSRVVWIFDEETVFPHQTVCSATSKKLYEQRKPFILMENASICIRFSDIPDAVAENA